MRRKIQSFVVEIKRKRGNNQETRRSLWSDVDLAAFSERTAEAETPQHQGLRHVDTDRVHNDAGERIQTQTEHLMEDPQEVQAVPAVAEAPAKVETPKEQQKAPRQKKAKADKMKTAASEKPVRKSSAKQAVKAIEAPAAVKGKRKTYSEKERSQKLTQIDRSVGRGESIRNAVKQAGISEQTYYHWKKDAFPTPVSTGGDLQDLLALEKENERLKKQLADHLRKENADLKKKLGLT